MAQSPPPRNNAISHGQPSGSHGGGIGPRRSAHNYRDDDEHEASYVEVGNQTNSVAFGVVLNHKTVVGNSYVCIYCIESCTTT